MESKICDDDFLFEHVEYVNVKAKWWKTFGPQLDDMEPVQKGNLSHFLHLSLFGPVIYHTILPCLAWIRECGNSPLFEDYRLPIATSRFGITLCGNPQPQVTYRYFGKEYRAQSKILDADINMYTNMIEIDVTELSQCGETVHVEAKSGSQKWNSQSEILVRCKYYF